MLAVVTLGWMVADAVITWLRVGYASVADVLVLLVGLVPTALALSLLIVLLRQPPVRTPSAVPELTPAPVQPAPPGSAAAAHLGAGRGYRTAWRTAGEAAAGAPAHPPVNQPPNAPATPDRHPLVGSCTADRRGHPLISGLTRNNAAAGTLVRRPAVIGPADFSRGVRNIRFSLDFRVLTGM